MNTGRVVAVIVFKADASWSHGPDAIVTMAGYVAMYPAWVDFELESRAMLKAQGVPFFHANEFFRTEEPFENWSRARKEAFARNWQHIAKGKINLGITYGVRKAKFEAAKATHKVAQQESAFGNCFREILGYLVADPILAELWKRGETLTVVLESGDPNGEDARRIFNQYKAYSREYDRIFDSFGFGDKPKHPGLQFADFLAVASRKYAERYSDEIGYAEETGIISALRDGIYPIDLVAEEFHPKKAKPS